MINLATLPRRPVEAVLAGLLSDSTSASMEAGAKLTAMARDSGLPMRDFLSWSIDTSAGDHAAALQAANLNGYEAALAHLKLPVRNDIERGMHLQAASDTFQRYPGTRALFPEVVDDMIRWKNRQDQIENTAAIVGQSRTITGVEMVSTVVEDDKEERGTFSVAELGRIPVRTIRTSQTAVSMYKHGSGYETSYEFARRASLDLVTPFAARVGRQLEISKVAAATAVLLNGDGVNGAAPVEKISDYDGDATKPLSQNFRALMRFIVKRAQSGNPVDTLLVNYGVYIEFVEMFFPKSTATGTPDAAFAPSVGMPALALPTIGNGVVTIALSSTLADNVVVAYSKAETLEELVEAGSSIAENERSILNQSVTYVRSEVTGYKLSFGDTRTVLKLDE